MAEYIEREKVLAEYDRQHKGPPGGARKIIETFPAANVRPVRYGKWEKHGWAIRCSECGYDMPFTVRNFCPNCGADMRGGEAGE